MLHYLRLYCSLILSQGDRTALQIAASHGNASLVTLLLDANAGVNLVDEVRYLPVENFFSGCISMPVQ